MKNESERTKDEGNARKRACLPAFARMPDDDVMQHWPRRRVVFVAVICKYL